MKVPVVLPLCASFTCLGIAIGIQIGENLQRAKTLQVLEKSVGCHSDLFVCQMKLYWCPKVGV